MKTIKLPCFGIVIKLSPCGTGSLKSKLKEKVPQLPSIKKQTKMTSDELLALTSEIESVKKYNANMDVVESIILAHACAGIDVTTPAYLEGIETAVDACEYYTF